MIFLRHPVPDSRPGLVYGRMDLGLGPGADVQIARALEVTPKGLPIISSPARRCLALATPLAARESAAVRQDERLWEMNFGDWEGLTWDEVPRDQSDPWFEDTQNLPPPGGESFAAVCTRVEAAVKDAPDGAIIVAHAGVIRAVKMVFLGQSFEEVFATEVPYAEPITIPCATS